MWRSTIHRLERLDEDSYDLQFHYALRLARQSPPEEFGAVLWHNAPGTADTRWWDTTQLSPQEWGWIIGPQTLAYLRQCSTAELCAIVQGMATVPYSCPW
jgi:hypothetical protein